MSSDELARLRRLWWVPFLMLVLLDLVWPAASRFLYGSHLAFMPVLIWAPAVLLLGAELALLSAVWPRLKEGGAFQMLLGVQAALPLIWIAIGRFGLYRWLAAAGPGMGAGFLLFALVRDLAQVGCLAGAFHLRGQEPEDGSLGVLASAGLVVLGGGWVGAGLGSLLALIWKDPLPSDLCGEGESGAARASLVGFLLLLSAPLVTAALLLATSAYRANLMGELLAAPALLLGSIAWTLLGARLGTAGRVWRVLTWVLFGFVALALALLVVLILAFSGRRLL